MSDLDPPQTTPSVIFGYDKGTFIQTEPTTQLSRLDGKVTSAVFDQCQKWATQLQENGTAAFIEASSAKVISQDDTNAGGTLDFRIGNLDSSIPTQNIQLRLRHIPSEDLDGIRADLAALADPTKLCVGMIGGGLSTDKSPVSHLTSLFIPKVQSLSSQLQEIKPNLEDKILEAQDRLAHMLKNVDVTSAPNRAGNLLKAWKTSIKDERLKEVIHTLSRDSAACKWEACFRQSVLGPGHSLIYRALGGQGPSDEIKTASGCASASTTTRGAESTEREPALVFDSESDDEQNPISP